MCTGITLIGRFDYSQAKVYSTMRLDSSDNLLTGLRNAVDPDRYPDRGTPEAIQDVVIMNDVRRKSSSSSGEESELMIEIG